ncbi:MAG: helix-turn-helix transcriptional regulator [Candidatus Heimdallarchaeota archaeon]|nr:helix-turn-helix transcriptional regulator [Candidatus Heimdallarchaeota archaeon]
MQIEDVFSSKGKVMILDKLSQKDMNITGLGRYCKMNHTHLQKSLKELEEMGLVEEKKYGRIRIYSLKLSSDTTLLKQFFFMWSEKQTDMVNQYSKF